MKRIYSNISLTNEFPPAYARPSTGNRLDDARRDLIAVALIKNKYNMAAAARDLGITYRAIRHYCKKWGL